MNKVVLLLLTILLVATGISQADDSAVLLRITCEPQDAGANISVNGVFKGQCSPDDRLDVFIPAGPTKVEAKKMPDAQHEQLFSEQFNAIAGVPKRIMVKLSAPQLTRAAKLKKQEEDFAATLRAAEAGNEISMAEVASLYESGTGVSKNAQQAKEWLIKLERNRAQRDLQAAERGDLAAMAVLIKRYKSGKGIEKDTDKAAKWQGKLAKIKEDERLRKEAKTRQEAATRRKAAMEKELAKSSYFHNLNDVFINPKRKPDFLAFLTMMPTAPVATLSDLLSAPTIMMERRDIMKKYESHAAAWAKPGSMLAKTYHQQQSEQNVPARIYAAR